MELAPTSGGDRPDIAQEKTYLAQNLKTARIAAD
jgi:hypothetical protein